VRQGSRFHAGGRARRARAEYLAWVDKKKTQLAAAAAGADKTWSKDELMAAGKDVYEKQCAPVTSRKGKASPPAFPALAGSKIVTGPLLSPDGKLIKDSHVDRVLNGKAGTAMQAFKTTLSDVRAGRRHHLRAQQLRQQQGRHDPARPDQVPTLRRIRRLP
jgi:cytochrome c oxidase subunit 2